MKTKRIIALLLIMTMVFTLSFTGCGDSSDYDPLEDVATVEVTDDTGRTVEIPEEITKIAPSGAVATMFLMTIAPEMLVGLSASPSSDQVKYFPEDMLYLPTFGQFYGSKANLNMEALISAQPQVIFDIGDKKATVKQDMKKIQKQVGIPTLFFEGTLAKLPNAYRQVGKILGREEKAEELAQFVEKTLAMAEENSAKISEEDMLKIMYGTGATGLAVNAAGSSQAQVIDLIGAKNAVVTEDVTDKGGGTIVSLESVYKDEPDVIILAKGGPYAELADSPEWGGLTAVKEGKYYEIPNDPYCWMSSPPSVNMVLGVWWLGQLVYPEEYTGYDIVEVAQEFYDKFWHYDLSEEEAKEMLANSYFK
ncbi:MAG: ABC transporter substrate-binding protein [Firmicutes bacterium]|nr:ABC transporter substrate-binding protein [Bacillota bacterium]